MMKRFPIFAALLAWAGMASAVDGVWNNTTTTGEQNYLNPANWTDKDGNPLTVAPTNAGDTAVIDVPENKFQTITIQGGTAAVSAFRGQVVNLGTVSGNMYHTIGSATDSNNNGWWMTLGFDDVSGFDGLWQPSRTKLNYSFSGTVKDVKMSEMVIAKRPNVYVPAQTAVTLEAIAGGGAIEKSGSGKLVIGTPIAGDRTIFYHQAGTLELKGQQDAATTFDMPGDPLFWVDASKTNLMDVTHDEETGRDYIGTWYDCRSGDGVHTKKATPINNAKLSKPWISSRLQNGLPVVDFGARTDEEVDALGPRASLQYSLGENAKEIFVVWMDTKVDGASDTFFIGQTGEYHFHRGYGPDNFGCLLDSAAHENVKNGFISLDGENVTRLVIPASGRFHIVNYSMLNNGLRPNTFCNDRTTTRYGGARIAEAVFFKDALTRGQREAVYRYLRDKWFVKEIEASIVKTASNAAAVSVPEGRTARVGRVVVAGASFAKTGAGTLKVGRFQPESPTIDVAAGAVGFDDEAVLASTAAPAADPVLWLDATKAESFVAPEGGSGVKTWKDCRPDKTGYAEAQQTDRYPYLSSETCNGLPVVDFGIQGNGDNTSMRLSCGNVIYEAFQVVKVYRQATDNKNQNIFGCSGQQLLRECTRGLLHTSYAYFEPVAGIWTVDGAFVDPWADFDFTSDTFHVASFSTEAVCDHVYLARDRNGKYGDQKIGEYIAYNRKLTEKERQQTIAYLMKRWKNADAPFAKAPAKIGRMNFTAENATPTVVTDVDTRIGSVTFSGQTSFVKKGAANLTVDSSFPQDVRNYEIEGDCVVRGPISIFPDAALHCDATCLDTFTFRAGQEEDKRIDCWYDCRGNGRYAKCHMGNGRTNAVLAVTGAEGTGGVLPGMPYVDFGTAAGMYWYESNNAQLTLANTREYHVVFMITASGNHQPISGDLPPNTPTSICPSGNLTGMFWTSGDQCRNGRFAAKKIDDSAWYNDNNWQPGGTALSTTKFYVQSVAATNNMSAYSFAIDRGTCGHGYVRLCEAIVFTGKTNTTERAEAIHAYLMNKWKGLGTNPISIGLGKMQVAAGGSLSLTSSVPLSVSCLSGGGTLAAERIVGVANIEASIDAENTVTGPTVAGTVAFAENVTVRVHVADAKALMGSYPLLSADALTNVDDVAFDVQVDDVGKKSCRLKKTATSLQLDVFPPGLVIVVR